MNITITGASGLIGRRLLKNLSAAGHSIHALSRHAGTNLPPGVKLSVWDAEKGPPPDDSLRDADAVINLAGIPIAQRWSADVKRHIYESRVAGTRNLVAGIAKLAKKPQVLVSSSAVGYYGSRGDELLDENSAPAHDFIAGLCVEWEKEARAAESIGVRVVCIRTGIVLDPRGGALKQMLPPFKMGAGGRLGDGRHYMAWIHAEDIVSLFRFAIDTPTVPPTLNGAAPNPVTNSEFTRVLAATLHRPAILPMPAFALNLLFGEMSSILLGSQRAVPKAAESAGFRFRYPDLTGALSDILTRSA